MHRDFKAANVLLHDGVLKIADLGFAKQMDQNSIAKTILGTSLTMAPEVL
jgi:serine/threonine protein kinase